MDTALLVQHAGRLASAWGDPIPACGESVKAVADDAVKGVVSFHCNGVHRTEVGRRNIDWRAPHHQHQEWPAQLNRFFQLGALASGFRATGDEEYALAARDYIEDWIRANPTRPGWQLSSYGPINDNVLNLCIRLGASQFPGWIGTLVAFLPSKAYDEVFVRKLVASALCQLDFLREHLAGASNWRIANADSLVMCGILLDPEPAAVKARDFGVRVLSEAFRRQILRDGVHDERNPSYHHWMTHVVERYWKLAREMPELGLEADAATVDRMYGYSVACTAPDGGWNGLHDSQSARTHISDDVSDAREQREEFRKQAGLPQDPAPTSQFFPDAGQTCLRDSWEEDANYVVFDATTWGGGHCHLSRNAVSLYVQGKPMLVDPGWLTYEMSDPMGAHGKSTRAHNTVNLNGWNQAETNPSRTDFLTRPGYDLMVSDYNGGYWPGPYTWWFEKGKGAGIWASHHRILLWVRGKGIVIIDDVTRSPAGGADPSPEINWQFERGPVQIEDQGRRVFTETGDANLLMLLPLIPDGMTVSIHEGEKDPIRGWLPSDQGYIPAPQLVLEQRTMKDWSAAAVTVLVPVPAGKPIPRVSAAVDPGSGQGPWRLTLAWEDGARDEVIWTRRLSAMIGSAGGWFTDASLAHIATPADGSSTAVAVYGGSHIDRE